jgi:hypothetical protein
MTQLVQWWEVGATMEQKFREQHREYHGTLSQLNQKDLTSHSQPPTQPHIHMKIVNSSLSHTRTPIVSLALVRRCATAGHTAHNIRATPAANCRLGL